MSKTRQSECSTSSSKRISGGTQPSTFDISYVPKRSVQLAKRELTYSTSAFSWKKNNALQTCTDTGVGDCPVCLGDRTSCHVNECQLCCEPKTCGPEFNACPFVPATGVQTDPLCDFTTLSCRCIGVEACGTSRGCRLTGNCATTGLECLCIEKSCNTTGQCIIVEDETGEYAGQCIDGKEENDCLLTQLPCRCRNHYQNYYTEKMSTHDSKTYSRQSLKGPHDTSIYVNSVKSFPTVPDLIETNKTKVRQTTTDRRETHFGRETVETEKIRKPQACYKETCGVCFADELVLKHERERALKSTINEHYEEGQSVKVLPKCKCGEDGECKQAKSSVLSDDQDKQEDLDNAVQEDLDNVGEEENHEETEEYHDVVEEADDEVKPDTRSHYSDDIKSNSILDSKHIIRNVATSVRPFKPNCHCSNCSGGLQNSGSHRLVLCECLTTSGGCIYPAKCSKSKTRQRDLFHENDEILILHLANSKKCNKCRPFNEGHNQFKIVCSNKASAGNI